MKNLWQLGIYAEFQDSEFAHRVPHEILRLERIKMKFHTLPLLLALSLFATGCTRVVKEPATIFMQKLRFCLSLGRSESARAPLRAHTLPLLLALSLFATGCTRVVKEPVYIPQKCAIDMPLRPTPHTDTAINVRNVLIYTEQLERDLRFCIRGE